MSGTLKAFVAKLKNRRRSRLRLWRHRRTSQVQSVNSEKAADALAEGMQGLNISPSTEKAPSFDPNSTAPHVFGSGHFKFDFALPVVGVTWPGPLYDEKCQFAPGIFDKPRHPKRTRRPKSSKRRLSQDERPLGRARSHRTTTLSEPVTTVVRSTKPSRQPQFYGSAPVRDPPNHLLNLPGEIRNEIYRILYLRDDPIFAQFRHIIKPKQGRNKKPKSPRRFPREPSLALVCRQLQQEVLSLFYGENKFIFRRSDNPKVAGPLNTLNMLHTDRIHKWGSKLAFAKSLRHVEVHFRGREPTFKSISIMYTFSKLVNGKFRVSNNAEDIEYCICPEKRAIRAFEAHSAEEAPCGDLVQMAVDFCTSRRESLRKDPSLSTEFPYRTYRPIKETCDECGLARLREIVSGL